MTRIGSMTAATAISSAGVVATAPGAANAATGCGATAFGSQKMTNLARARVNIQTVARTYNTEAFASTLTVPAC
jgi:hypothetical protein